MRFENHNQEVAAAWASAILASRDDHAAEKKINAIMAGSRFRFFALNDLAPINAGGWARAVADQSRLAAHTIISALDDQGHAAYWAKVGEAAANGFRAVCIAGVNVDIDYRNYDVTCDGELLQRVNFDLALHVSR